MTDPSLFRSTPDPAYSSARPAPGAEELSELDRRMGGLVVNRWTYRPLRLLTRLLPSPPAVPGVTESRALGSILLTPAERRGRGAVLFFHGGGYVIGSNDQARFTASDLAARAGVPVLCPPYRLGPRHPFPAPLEDALAAWDRLQEGAGALGIDPARVVLGGSSAGAGLATTLSHRLLDRGGVQPAARLLIYPMLDDRTAAQTALDRPAGQARHRVWSNANNRFGWTSYLGGPPGGAVPEGAVPARRADLRGLPPTWIGVGTSDLFLDEDRAYAGRLAEAGVEVTYLEAAGGLHGFETAETPMGAAFRAAQAEFLRRHS